MNSLWEHLGELLESDFGIRDFGTCEFFFTYNQSAVYGNHWTKMKFFNNCYS